MKTGQSYPVIFSGWHVLIQFHPLPRPKNSQANRQLKNPSAMVAETKYSGIGYERTNPGFTSLT